MHAAHDFTVKFPREKNKNNVSQLFAMDYKSMEGAPKPKQGVLQKYGKTIICSLANFSTAYNLQSIQLAVLFLKGLGHGTFTFSTRAAIRHNVIFVLFSLFSSHRWEAV